MTQEDIYKLVAQATNEERCAVMDKAKAAGLIAYDHREMWYRPVAEIGTPIDNELYFRYFPRPPQHEIDELKARMELLRN